jgi:hypothetical protein
MKERTNDGYLKTADPIAVFLCAEKPNELCSQIAAAVALESLFGLRRGSLCPEIGQLLSKNATNIGKLTLLPRIYNKLAQAK